MAEITLAQAQEHLDAWMRADLAVAKGQSFAIDGQTFTRADAEQIRENIEIWEARVRRLQTGGGGLRVRNAIADV